MNKKLTCKEAIYLYLKSMDMNELKKQKSQTTTISYLPNFQIIGT